jgi:endonuclease/exonuclease/phosphatase family metal-dependent hydrolase
MLPLLLIAATDSIVMDGQFDDWANVTNTICMDTIDAPSGGPDLGVTKWTADGSTLHLWLELSPAKGPLLNLQAMDYRLLLVLDADGNTKSGEQCHGLSGTDAILSMPGPDRKDPNKPGMGAALLGPTGEKFQAAWVESGTQPAWSAGIATAPATSGRAFEFSIGRRKNFLSGPSANLKWMVLDAEGGVIDETPASTIPLPKFAPAKPTFAKKSDFARGTDVDFRLVNWNVEWGNLLDEREPAGTLLAALDPDAILLQEMMTDQDEDEIVAMLEEAMPDADGWEVQVGKDGGRIRCAVAIRSNRAASLPGLSAVATNRSAAAAIRTKSGPVVLIATHLKCCGRDGSKEDTKRITEAEDLRDAITKRLGKSNRVVLAGDLNLVGSRTPLDRLEESGLTTIEMRQPDGATMATWDNESSSFLPGRLDYVLHSRQLTPKMAVVFDTQDVDPSWLPHSLRRQASDHLPLVVDFKVDR